MLFNSVQFLIFFPLVCLVILLSTYILKKNIINQILLLAASLYFYMCWNPAYLLLILTSVLITYMSGLCMENKSSRRKKLILTLSLISNLGILFFFKYANFIAGTIYSVFRLGSTYKPFDILLPVGISFYTFQALGYSIDVYRGTIKAERNVITYALFVTFFPQLVAGPIERSENLLSQFKVDHTFDYDRVTDGLKRAAWGMFKKVVVADTLAVYVNAFYDDITGSTGIAAVLAVFFFSFQILCDFSGYSDIAIGTAKVLGFNLMDNFRRPYFAKTVGEFWRRWHISLSSWFKDYVYIPLGGNKVCRMKHYSNILITFLMSGLWHGAAWHFVFWGFLHGIVQVISLVTASARKNIRMSIGINEKNMFYKVWQIFFTFCFVTVAWIFFRAHSMSEGFTVLRKVMYFPADILRILQLIMGSSAIFGEGFFKGITLGMSKIRFAVMFFLIAILFAADMFGRKKSILVRIKSLPFPIRWTGYYALVLSIFWVWFANISANSQFIYFQF